MAISEAFNRCEYISVLVVPFSMICFAFDFYILVDVFLGYEVVFFLGFGCKSVLIYLDLAI